MGKSNLLEGIPLDPFYFWERSDTAYVWPDTSFIDKVSWIAFGPDQRTLTKATRNSKIRANKKWKTPEAAMKAVDKEYPIKESL